MPVLGGIADDFTGATDLATTLVARGFRTRVIFGVPDARDAEDSRDVDAVIVGLKSRSGPVDQAVNDSVNALRFLRSIGCTQYYDKYCATFDSTPEGNIGPILDALMHELDAARTVVVLPFPEAGRTVYSGHLFVHGVPLDETSMRNHPITPMTDSSVRRLLEPQTRNAVHEVALEKVRGGAESLAAALQPRSPRDIFVIDAIERSDLDTIARVTSGWTLVSGGAGLSASFAPSTPETSASTLPVTTGYRAVLSGSASLETQQQVKHAKQSLPSYKFDAAALRDDFDAEIARIEDWAVQRWAEDPQRPVLVFSVEDPSDIDVSAAVDGAVSTAQLTEQALGACARALSSRGMTGLIVAGGESSGAVTQALGVRSFEVGVPLTPGVAWAAGANSRGETMNLLLKSGSLGSPDIFTSAWSAM